MNAGASGEDILRLCVGRVCCMPLVCVLPMPVSEPELSSLCSYFMPLVCPMWFVSPFLVSSGLLFAMRLDPCVFVSNSILVVFDTSFDGVL